MSSMSIDSSPKRSSASSSPRRSTQNLSLSIPGAGPSGSSSSKRYSATLSERSLETPMTARSRLSQWTDTDSFAALVPGGDVERVREQLRLDLDDFDAVRASAPQLDAILGDTGLDYLVNNAGIVRRPAAGLLFSPG